MPELLAKVPGILNKEMFRADTTQRIESIVSMRLNNVYHAIKKNGTLNNEELMIDWERLNGMIDTIEAMDDKQAAQSLKDIRNQAWKLGMSDWEPRK